MYIVLRFHFLLQKLSQRLRFKFLHLFWHLTVSNNLCNIKYFHNFQISQIYIEIRFLCSFIIAVYYKKCKKKFFYKILFCTYSKDNGLYYVYLVLYHLHRKISISKGASKHKDKE